MDQSCFVFFFKYGLCYGPEMMYAMYPGRLCHLMKIKHLPLFLKYNSPNEANTAIRRIRTPKATQTPTAEDPDSE